MTLQEQIDALPEWPNVIVLGPDVTAALARLALAREWIEDNGHAHNCASRRGVHPCDCYRDALLKALEVPR